MVEPASIHSLGQSIQTLKSNVDAIGAAQAATLQAVRQRVPARSR